MKLESLYCLLWPKVFKKQNFPQSGTMISKIAYFKWETIDTEENRTSLKCLKEKYDKRKTCQPGILYPANISFKRQLSYQDEVSEIRFLFLPESSETLDKIWFKNRVYGTMSIKSFYTRKGRVMIPGRWETNEMSFWLPQLTEWRRFTRICTGKGIPGRTCPHPALRR